MLSQRRCPRVRYLLPIAPQLLLRGTGDSVGLGERCQTILSSPCHGNSTWKIQRCRTCFKTAKLTVLIGKQLHCQPINSTNAALSWSTKLPICHCQARWKNQPPNVAVNFFFVEHDVDGHKPTTMVMTVVPHVTKLPQPSNWK